MFEVLHVLRLKGVVPVDALAELTGLTVDAARSTIERLAGDGLAKLRETPRVSGWTLTELGHERHRAELDGHRSAELVEALTPVYERFLGLNGRVKQLASEWQGLATEDTAGRWDAIERLRELHAAAAPILDDAAGIASRLAPYARRLASAIERLEGGDERFFTGVTVDSFHTVWFECHEDLIQTLGRERVAEGSF